jgi:transcriptional regulator with XRE-family HTH domain
MGSMSLRSLQGLTGVSPSTALTVLSGSNWPDLHTIVRLEQGLGVALWPVMLPGFTGRSNDSSSQRTIGS